MPFFDEAMGEQVTEWFTGAEDFLLGRGTYDIFYASWPKMISDDPVSQGLNFKNEARRLADAARRWSGRPRSCCRATSPDAVRKLKAEDGGELQVHGSAGLIQTLLAEDLVDELRVIVFPVTLGEGKRLFGEGTIPRTWRLTATRITAQRRRDAQLRARRRGRDGLRGPRARHPLMRRLRRPPARR